MSSSINSSDMAVWVKGEVALHHLIDDDTNWSTTKKSKHHKHNHKNHHHPKYTHGSLPSPRFQHASVQANGKLIIVGGSQGTEIFNDIHVFEPTTFRWTKYLEHDESQLQDQGRARHTVTFMKEKNALFLFGGINISGIASNNVYMLHLKDDLKIKRDDEEGYNTFRWHEIKVGIGQEIPTARFAHCAVSICNKLFIFGGERKNKKLSNTLFRFDPDGRGNDIDSQGRSNDNVFSGSWSRSLQHQSAKAMAPPAGKDYRMLAIPPAAYHAGTHHMIVLGTNLNFIYIIPVERSTGRPISWDTLGATGQIPGAMSSSTGQSLTPVRRQYAASVVNTTPLDQEAGSKGKRSKSKKNKKDPNTAEIIIFGGIVHNPKSSLTDEIHSLTINVVEGNAKWKELPQRGRSIPSARIGHSFTFMQYKSKQTSLINHQMFMFGGTDSQAFRQDFFVLDLATPISKVNVTMHIGKVHQYEHSPRVEDLCAPRGATVTRIWNTKTLKNKASSKKKTETDPEGKNEANAANAANEENQTNDENATVETAQFIVVGGSRCGATNQMDTSWTIPLDTLIGYHGDVHATQCITRLLTRDLKKKDKWEIWENITCAPNTNMGKDQYKYSKHKTNYKDATAERELHYKTPEQKAQISELIDEQISTFCGHTATLFADQNMLVVYGGATAENMLMPQGDNCWVLWLGDRNKGGVQGWKRNIILGSSGNGGSSSRPNSDMSDASDAEGSNKHDKSDKTTTSGSESGGSDNEMGGTTRFHPVGVDLRASKTTKYNLSNSSSKRKSTKSLKGTSSTAASASTMNKILKKELLTHPRNKIKWKKVNVKWPINNGNTDANGDRIGHGAASYGPWLYVVGGCTTSAQYKADVFRIKVCETIDDFSLDDFTFENTEGCTYEKCTPLKQNYSDLLQNIMTPRSGHTVTGRGSKLYVYGGGTDGFVEDQEMYSFDADSYVWTRIR